jgi:hypothetical protein
MPKTIRTIGRASTMAPGPVVASTTRTSAVRTTLSPQTIQAVARSEASAPRNARTKANGSPAPQRVTQPNRTTWRAIAATETPATVTSPRRHQSTGTVVPAYTGIIQSECELRA